MRHPSEYRWPSCEFPLSTDKALVESRLPPMVRERYQRFSTCDCCARVFWEGSHWQRMCALLNETLVDRQRSFSGARDEPDPPDFRGG